MTIAAATQVAAVSEARNSQERAAMPADLLVGAPSLEFLVKRWREVREYGPCEPGRHEQSAQK